MSALLDIDWDEAPVAVATPHRFALRGQQPQWLATIISDFATKSRLLVVAPGGVGKTTLFAALAAHYHTLGIRTLVLENRDRLTRQTADRIRVETGIEVDIEMGDEHASPFAPIVVASVQTLGRVSRLTGFSDTHFGLIVADEAHFSLAPQWQRVLCYFHYGAHSLVPDWKRPEDGTYEVKARCAGFTATPDIGERRNLGQFFHHRSVNYSYLEAVQDGWLVGPVQKNIPVRIDLSKYKAKSTPNGNDFAASDLSAALIPIIEELAEQILIHASAKKTIAFLPSVECARMMTDALLRRGMRAIFVSGECLDASEKTDEFAALGAGSVLVNCCLYVYGVDFPDVDCIAWFRATISKAFYIQGIYRGTRVLPGILNGLKTAEERRNAIASSSKPNCIAEGSQVLTNLGLVPIEKLTKSHLLWDGTCFVEHEGVKYMGEQETITHEGLTATPDHRVWTRFGWKTLEEVSSKQIGICITGRGRKAIREAEGYFTGDTEARGADISVCGVHWMWQESVAKKGFALKEGDRVQEVRKSEVSSKVAEFTFQSGEIQMHESELCALEGLWRTRNKISFRFSAPYGYLDSGEPWSTSPSGNRQDRQQRSLRARKFKIFNEETARRTHEEKAACGKNSQIQNEASEHTLRGRHVAQVHRSRPEFRLDCEQIPRVFHKTKRRVWDVVNAGPLHRFTCEGLLVHNCLILDPLFVSDRIDLLDAYDLLTDEPEVKKAMKASGELSVESAQKAERDFLKSLKKEAKKHERKTARTIDPLSWACSLGDSMIRSYVPTEAWESQPASVGQLDFIRSQGMEIGGITSKGLASRIISRLRVRQDNRLATPRQLRLMHSFGLDEQTCATLTQAEATATIDRILQSKRERGGLTPAVA